MIPSAYNCLAMLFLQHKIDNILCTTIEPYFLNYIKGYPFYFTLLTPIIYLMLPQSTKVLCIINNNTVATYASTIYYIPHDITYV
jgi:hypothetical protein